MALSTPNTLLQGANHADIEVVPKRYLGRWFYGDNMSLATSLHAL